MRMFIPSDKIIQQYGLRWMCKNHLLGNHKEVHMIAGCVARGKSLKGYIASHFIELHLLHWWHTTVVNEMKRRGWKHKTPLQICGCEKNHPQYFASYVDREQSIIDLIDRCETCRNNLRKIGVTK